MTVYFNEKPVTCPDGTTLSGLLEEQGLIGKRVAVAVDDQLIKKDAWSGFRLREGQYVVVITVTFGG